MHSMSHKVITVYKDLSHSPTYRSWYAMLQRCNNTKEMSYKHYGARGISVCDSWMLSYQDFLQDMGERPSLEHSLDRIDNNGHYCPENCRWATRVEQLNNKRTNVHIDYNGQSMTVAQWARHIGIKTQTLRMRLYRGWQIEKALRQLI